MLSRRHFLATAAAASATGVAGSVRAAPVLTDDGLYTQPWFLESFLEMQADLDEAAAGGKRLAVVWELKGCPACKDTHFLNFARPEVETYIKERFAVVQMNIIGAREVTDFDGERLPEKRFAEKYGIRFTPTIQFFPERADGLAAKKPRDREVARLQGYMPPAGFLRVFTYVAEKAYERGPLKDYLAQG